MLLNNTRYTQPQGAVEIDWASYPTCSLAVSQYYDFAAKALLSKTGTKLSPATNGIVTGFGSTSGVSSTDKVTTTLTRYAQRRTYLVVALSHASGGGGNLGRLFEKRTAGAQSELFYKDDLSGLSHYGRAFSGSAGQWAFTSPSNDSWHVYIVRYDSGSISNVPVIWVDGVTQSLTTFYSPSGTLIDNSDPYTIGNRASDSLRNWSGQIALVSAFDSILTDQQCAALSANPWQLFAPIKRQIWVPLSTPTGPTTHTTTGTLTLSSTLLSGSASLASSVVNHGTTGSLILTNTLLAGTSARTRVHDTTASIISTLSSIVGSSARERIRTTIGSLLSNSTTVSGSAAHVVPGGTHATDGSLVSTTSALTGSSNHVTVHSTVGVLQALGVTLSGTSSRTRAHSTSGVLPGVSAALSGTSARARIRTTVGNLVSSITSLVGSAARSMIRSTNGTLVGSSSTIVGSASRSYVTQTHSVSGSIVGPSSIIYGAATMPHLNYTALVNKVRDWSNKTETAALPESVIDDCIGYAADDCYRDLRIPQMEYSFEYTIQASDNAENSTGLKYTTMTIPADLVEFIYIRLKGDNLQNSVVFNNLNDKRTFVDPYAEKYSRWNWTWADGNIMLMPQLEVGTVVELHYYRKLPSIVDASSNWIRDSNDRLVVWGALSYLGAYLFDDKMEARYKEKFANLVASMNNEEKVRRTKGGNVQINMNGMGLI